MRVAGHEVERRTAGDIAVDDGAERIGLHTHLEALLSHRRCAPAGAALRTVAEHEGDGVPLAQRLAHDVDADRLEPGPEGAARVVLDKQLRAVRGRRRAVVRRPRPIELRPAGIARETQQKAHAALVVDAELAGGVDDAHRRHRAGDGLRVAFDADVAERLGRVGQAGDVGVAGHGGEGRRGHQRALRSPRACSAVGLKSSFSPYSVAARTSSAR